MIATKIRLVSEAPGRPAFALRFATRLPNASNESGIGLDTTDFFLSGILGKTVQSIRVVGNFGFGHPDGSDARLPSERRHDLRHVARPRRQAGGRDRRRGQRPLEHA